MFNSILVVKIFYLCLNIAFFVVRINLTILNTLAKFTGYLYDLVTDPWVGEGRIILNELFWGEQ